MAYRIRGLAIVLALFLVQGQGFAQSSVETDGTVHVPAFDLPLSSYLSEDSREAMQYFREVYASMFGSIYQGCPNLFDTDNPAAARQCIAENYYETAVYKDSRAKHPVDLSVQTIGGVYTEVWTPRDGIAPENEDKVLISVHGGGYTVGARYFAHTESMQVADIGRIKVISPDYRMAPEHTHPAGVEDVIAVYQEVLKEYQPHNIGIFGCSSGAMLTAQVTAFIHLNELPMPAAIGLFCAGAPTAAGSPGVFKMSFSEAGYIGAAIGGNPRQVENPMEASPGPYFANVMENDPVLAPGDYDEVLAAFPPTLLISGTRDFAMSGVIATHTRLTRLGVEADLHIWEGLGHATFAFNPRLPESDEVHNVMVNFFARHLGKEL